MPYSVWPVGLDSRGSVVQYPLLQHSAAGSVYCCLVGTFVSTRPEAASAMLVLEFATEHQHIPCFALKIACHLAAATLDCDVEEVPYGQIVTWR